MLKIENVSGRMVTYVLNGRHLAAAGTPHSHKPVKRVTVHQSKDGQLVPRILERPMADSLRIPAGESVQADDAVGHCPSIKKALLAGEIKISRVVKPAEKNATPAA